MAANSASADRALELYRRGDEAGARREAEAALAARPGDPALLRLLGTLSCRAGSFAEAAGHFRRALELTPGDVALRTDLAMALAAMGRHEEAMKVCDDALASADELPLRRLQGQLLQAQGRDAEAVHAYEQVLVREPGDWQIWNNVGNARLAAGNSQGAAEALGRAAAIRPDVPSIQANFAAALVEARRFDEALNAYRLAIVLAPGEPAFAVAASRLLGHLLRFDEAVALLESAGESVEVRLERASALSGLRRLDEAEQAYRALLRERPDLSEAWLDLGIVIERAGRLEDLPAVVEAAEGAGVPVETIAYLRALLLDREGRTAEALDALARASEDVEPRRTERLRSKLADKLNDPALAFAAAARANAMDSGANDGAARAAGFRAHVEELIPVVTPGWHRQWAPTPAAPAPPAPAFLIGFPRSGTTLLDTMLMGHRDAHVLEEIPLLGKVMEAVGETDRIAALEGPEIWRLRQRYFVALEEAAPPPAGALVIDKLPLNILGAPLIQRLFPGAPIIFALRHPGDVMLSCFMQGFEMNDAMANFLDLEDTARLYDLVMTFWEQCREVLPLRVHVLRYESLVADAETEMRALIAFLGLEWDDAVLDHQRTAVARGVISSPSYNQVTRKIYREASGRWQRYREQLAPALPVIEKWAERFGYS